MQPELHSPEDGANISPVTKQTEEGGTKTRRACRLLLRAPPAPALPAAGLPGPPPRQGRAAQQGRTAEHADTERGSRKPRRLSEPDGRTVGTQCTEQVCTRI